MASVDGASTEDTSPVDGDWSTMEEGFAADEDYQPEPPPRPRQQPGSACEECRRRKSRCDRRQPTCSECASAGVQCVFRRACPPRGPKKGHLRALRGQIAALESRLNEQNNKKESPPSSALQTKSTPSSISLPEVTDITDNGALSMPSASTPLSGDLPMWFATTSVGASMSASMPHMRMDSIESLPHSQSTSPLDIISMQMDSMEGMNFGYMAPSMDTMPIGVHMTTLVCTDLDQLYFSRVHTAIPMLQKFRYMSWSNQANKSKEKTCLQYTMWALAAYLSSQFQSMRNGLYKEARQMLETLDEDNERTVEQVQAWILLSIYEFLCDQYQRGLVSAGRALRLAQIMRLYDLDNQAKVSPFAGADWIDVESMRRTFWIAYKMDRFIALYEGLSLSCGEYEIRNRLPAPEAQFMSGRAVTMPYLSEVMNPSDAGSPEEATAVADSPLVKTIIMATICGRVQLHKQKSAHETNPEVFIRRDNDIAALLKSHVDELTLEMTSSMEYPDPTLIFASMTAHTMVLKLYDIIKTMPLRSREINVIMLGHKQRAVEAARKLDNLATILPRLNQFEIHPFTPIPLMLSFRFCLAHLGCTSYPSMEKALQNLTSVNGLAKKSLQILGRGMPETL